MNIYKPTSISTDLHMDSLLLNTIIHMRTLYHFVVLISIFEIGCLPCATVCMFRVTW